MAVSRDPDRDVSGHRLTADPGLMEASVPRGIPRVPGLRYRPPPAFLRSCSDGVRGRLAVSEEALLGRHAPGLDAGREHDHRVHLQAVERDTACHSLVYVYVLFIYMCVYIEWVIIAWIRTHMRILTHSLTPSHSLTHSLTH